jgi:hypothetical protein
LKRKSGAGIPTGRSETKSYKYYADNFEKKDESSGTAARSSPSAQKSTI